MENIVELLEVLECEIDYFIESYVIKITINKLKV